MYVKMSTRPLEKILGAPLPMCYRIADVVDKFI